jgi:hypothetical protein
MITIFRISKPETFFFSEFSKRYTKRTVFTRNKGHNGLSCEVDVLHQMAIWAFLE